MTSPTDSTYKWKLLVYLFGAFFLDIATRQIFSATLPSIQTAFAATDAQMGSVGTVFGLVFGLSLAVSGFAADFWDRKGILIVGTVLFSLGIVGSGLAVGMVSLIACYGVLNALGQSCIAPPSYSLISQHHGLDTRARAMGIYQSAVYVGIILSSVLAGYLAGLEANGWRMAFLSFGLFGLVWAVVMGLGLRKTPQPVAAEKVTIAEGLRALFGKPTAIYITLAFGMFMYACLGIRLWATTFVFRSFPGLTLAQAAFHSVFWLYLGSFAGMFLTARFLDAVGARRPRIRLEVSAISFLLCIGPVVWLARSASLVECCFALGTLGATMGVYDASHYPAMFDCIAPRYRSVTTGLTGCWAFVFGSFGSLVLGFLSQHFSMRVGFLSLSVFYIAGAALLLPALVKHFNKDFVQQ